MAGTRLLVHSIFLGQFLLLVAASLYFGLCQRGDRVCVPLFQQDGRVLLQQEDSESVLSQALIFAPVTLVSADSQVPFWNKTLQRIIRLDSDHIRVQKDESGHLQVACSNPVSQHANHYEMWLCEPFLTGDKARMVVRNGTCFFYPTSISRGMDELESIYPHSLGPSASSSASSQSSRATTATTSVSRANRLHLIIAIDSNRSDWKLWMAAVNEWMVASRVQQWPCLDESPKVDFQVVDWSQKVRPVTTVVNEDDDDSNNTTTTTMSTAYQLLLDEKMLSSLPPLGDGPSDSTNTRTWHATVYIPSQFPLTVEEDSTDVVAKRDNHVMTVIPQEPRGDSDYSYSNLTHAALGSITDWMMTRCMGLPMHENTATKAAIADSDMTAATTARGSNVVWDSDGSFPQWYLQLWFQRVLPAVYNDTVSTVRRERQLLLQKPRTVAITVQVAESWQRAVAGIEQAFKQCRQGDFYAALNSLDLLGTHPNLDELSDFPLEQYGAIIWPLLVPLLLPMPAGLAREVKRY
jgi:hypothetical protein